MWTLGCMVDGWSLSLWRATPWRALIWAWLWLGMHLALFPASAAASTNTTGSQRALVLEAMQKRPDDVWPRGAGHVVLAYPGSRDLSKGYHEPGGSFSPCSGSFGLSLWVADAQGGRTGTSDTLSMDQVSQKFEWAQAGQPPSLVTDTAYYRAQWTCKNPSVDELILAVPTNATARIQLVVRSVGPSGGPVTLLRWTGKNLVINNRWTVTCDPLPAKVYMGKEESGAGLNGAGEDREVKDPAGWGFARLVFKEPGKIRVTVFDAMMEPIPRLTWVSTQSGVNARLPEPLFIPCMNAQVAHMMMGLSDLETRSCEPTSCPIAWQRDAAYMVVALAQSGRLEVARQLITMLAEKDFFGGYGPEADAPGLALWAMDEVDGRLRQASMHSFLLPHAARKVETIRQMHGAVQPLRRPVSGTVMPEYIGHRDLNLLCQPARDNLIVGKVDWRPRVLYVNGVSYRGLIAYANMADRVGQTLQTLHLRVEAAQMRESWVNVFKREPVDEYALATTLWPTWVAGFSRDDMSALLMPSQRGGQQLDGASVGARHGYHQLQMANQWLVLGRTDRVWEVLRSWWKDQASPGLFTWKEEQGEPDPFHNWEKVRGWVTQGPVTPYYRTAAAMLSLQLNMLAYVDDTAAEPVLIIGAGIPADWMARPLSVQGVSTRVGMVNWTWQAGRMRVTIRGLRCPVRLGRNFGPNAAISVDYL